MWHLKNRKLVYEDEFVSFYKDDLTTSSGRATGYSHFSGMNGVIIVPVEIVEDQINYILVDQYRYPINANSLELPRGGLKDPQEDIVEAALRELLEETGYRAQRHKVLGFINPMNNASSIRCGVVLVQVGEQTTPQLEEEEIDCNLTVKKMSAEELMVAIQNNEIMDGHTLSALTLALFNSKKIKEFLSDRGIV